MISMSFLAWSLVGLSPGAEVPGVMLRIWEVGHDMVRRPHIEPGQLPSAAGVVPELNLTGPQDFLGFADHFVLMADGNLLIDQPGVFEFQLTSDDGSELWIAGNRVIDHGGLHGAESRTGRLALEAGSHPFQVKFFENQGDEILKLEWKPPLSAGFTVIPREVLRTRLDPDLPVRPGRKRFLGSTMDRLPGHGVSIRGVHPHWNHQRVALPRVTGRVTGMEWTQSGDLVMVTDAGQLWKVAATTDTATPDVRPEIMADGLEDPGGLVLDGQDVWVIQRGELTRLRDSTGDGRIDQFEAMATGWPITGHDAGPARGLIPNGDSFLVTLGRARDQTGQPRGSEHRGTILRLERDGSWDIVDDGLMDPEGFLVSKDGRVSVIDLAASGGLHPLDGSGRLMPSSQVYWPAALTDGTAGDVPAAIEIPVGPYAGQALIADGQQGRLVRMQFDPHDSGVQGAVFRASHGLGERIDHLVTDGDGDIWAVGHDGSQSELHRFRARARSGFEMKRLTAYANGLKVEFSEPFNWRCAADPAAWRLTEQPLASSGTAGRPLVVRAVYPLDGDRSVFLEVPDLVPEQLIHLQLVGPWKNDLGERLYSNEAWYTMLQVPTRKFEDRSRPRRIAHNVLTPREQAEGWRLLFDGNSLESWRGYGRPEVSDGWQIIDGMVVRAGPAGDLMTVESFDDFELSLEWRISPGGNSGIFFNVDPTGETPWQTGPEMQILDNSQHTDGSNPLTSAGANYALHPPAFDTSAPANSWNHARIIVRGDEVEHWLNGVRVVSYVLGTPEWQRRVGDSKFQSMPDYGRRSEGHIVLQDHGDEVAFRNLKIRVTDSDTRTGETSID